MFRDRDEGLDVLRTVKSKLEAVERIDGTNIPYLGVMVAINVAVIASLTGPQFAKGKVSGLLEYLLDAVVLGLMVLLTAYGSRKVKDRRANIEHLDRLIREREEEEEVNGQQPPVSCESPDGF